MNNNKNPKNTAIKSIAINLNQICNLACTYCYRHVMQSPTSEISDQVLEQAIEFIRKTSPEQISFPQREPTLSFSKLKYIVEELGDGYKYHVTTNGYALTQKMIDFFKAHNFGVLISYDSVMHCTSRPTVGGGDSEPRVRESCRQLLAAGLNPTVLQLVTEQSLPHIEEMLEDVIGLGFTNIFLNRDSQVNSPTCVRSVDLFEQKMRAAKAIADRHGLKIGPFARMESRAENRNGRLKTPNEYVCGAGKGGIAIDPDGNLYPCHHTNAWKELRWEIGHVTTGVDWEKKEWFRTAEPSGEQYAKCRSCGYTLCGMCYLDNHENTGDMLKPAKISCDVMRALYRAADIPLHQVCNSCTPSSTQKPLTGEVMATHSDGTYDIKLSNGQVITRVALSA